jgi:hypothetical protein
MKNRLPTLLMTTLTLSFLLIACNNKGTGSAAQNDTAEATDRTSGTPAGNENTAQTEERLRRFDSLDFVFYNHQQWDSLAISHADNIKVYYPDGTVTDGLFPQHIDKLKPLFAFAPDTRITTHPVRFGSGDWTAVIGEMEGTFSRPMDMGGKVIQPTGKKFRLRMCTVGKWRGDKMVEEHLFWDNQTMMKQIGVAQ